MDFIERVLHISPDNGSGMLELAYALALAACAAFALKRRAVSSALREITRRAVDNAKR